MRETHVAVVQPSDPMTNRSKDESYIEAIAYKRLEAMEPLIKQLPEVAPCPNICG